MAETKKLGYLDKTGRFVLGSKPEVSPDKMGYIDPTTGSFVASPKPGATPETIEGTPLSEHVAQIDPTTGATADSGELPFPKSSIEMEEYQKKQKAGDIRWDAEAGRWYKVAPKAEPIGVSPKEIIPGGALPREGEVKTMDGKEYKWIGDKWEPIIKDEEIIGKDEEIVGTSDIAREEDEGTQEKIEIAKGIEDDQVETQKLTAKQELQKIREEMGLDPDTGLKKPVLPSYADDFEALRAEEGVSALETQVNSIDKDIRDIEAGLRADFDIEEGRSVWTRLIGKEKQKLQGEARESIDALNRRKQTLVDELNTKNTLISNIMSFKQLDYNAASTAYNQDFTQKVQLLNIVEGRIDRADQEANRQRDDARANLSILQNLIKDVDWAQVGNSVRTQIEDLESKAGLPIGITEAFVRANPGISVDYTTTGYDADGNQITSFYSYNDGDPKLIKTITTTGVRPGIAEEETEKQSEKGILSVRIGDYMDLWKTKGDKGAGTREEFAADMARDSKHLTYQEILAAVYAQVTNAWLEENRRWHIGAWRTPFTP